MVYPIAKGSEGSPGYALRTLTYTNGTPFLSEVAAARLSLFIENSLLKNPERYLKGRKAAILRYGDFGLPNSLLVTKEGEKIHTYILLKKGRDVGKSEIDVGARKRVRMGIEYGSDPRLVAPATIKHPPNKKSIETTQKEVEVMKLIMPSWRFHYLLYLDKVDPEIEKEMVILPYFLKDGLAFVLEDKYQHEREFLWPLVAENTMELLARMANEHGLFNRDIKPENLLIGEGGEVGILDWDFATTKDNPDKSPKGTNAFVPPDAFQEAADWEKQDVFSMGILLFMLARKVYPPWIQNNFLAYGGVEELQDDYNIDWEDWAKKNSNPSLFEKLAWKMTDPKPEERPTMQKALEEFKTIRREPRFVR